jgi:periplasmic copper chaperone A
MNRCLLARAGVVSAATAAVALALAGPASAHVTVNPNAATAGSYTKVTFRVPTESATASTTKLEVNLPTDTPIASVAVKPLTGWTAVTTTTKLATPIKTGDREVAQAVSKIVWTAAAGSEIAPGQFQEFDVSLGPLPSSGQLVFKALQTYSDGSIVRWIDAPTTDGTEPEHPAPVLTLTAASATNTAAPTEKLTAGDVSDDNGSGAAFGLAAAGLVIAVLAVLLGLLAYRRAGTTGTTASPPPHA